MDKSKINDKMHIGLPDFAIVEDSPTTKLLEKLVAQAAIKAIKENRALGLSITYVKDGQIVEESADGTVTVISMLENVSHKAPLKKGDIVYVKSL